MLACFCLNVIIESEGNDFEKVNVESLLLNEDEAQDIFFKQDISRVGKLLKINKVHSTLVNTRTVGSWSVQHCINCNINTHALHREKGAGFLLISSKLLSSHDILNLRKSNQFSNVFNIIVDTNVDEEKSNDYLPAEVELTVGGLKQQVNEYINREVAATEEKVRHFTERQYEALDEYREKALREHRALTRVILKDKVNIPHKEVERSSDMAYINVPKPITVNVPEENDIPTKPVVVRTKSTDSNSLKIQSPEINIPHKLVSQKNSFDAEGLFQLEDMDDLDMYPNSEGDGSGQEDDGIPANNRYTKINQPSSQQMKDLAKSLPMNIPVFMSPFHGHENEEQEDILPHPEDPMDIAASIKALAKSVHGDTVFGDLPRPRFSTHI